MGGAEARRTRPRRQRGRGIHELPTIGRVAGAGEEPPRDGIPHVAHGIHDHERGRDDSVPVHAGHAQSAAHGALDAVELADGGARARAHAAFGHGACARRRGGGMAHGPVGSRAMVAHGEIEDDGARHMRDDGAGHGKAAPALLEPLHHAPDRLEAVGAAAGQHDRVHRRRKVTRVEELEPVHGGRPSGDLERARGGALGHDDGAPGEPAVVGDMAHAQAGNHAGHSSKFWVPARAAKPLWVLGQVASQINSALASGCALSSNRHARGSQLCLAYMVYVERRGRPRTWPFELSSAAARRGLSQYGEAN